MVRIFLDAYEIAWIMQMVELIYFNVPSVFILTSILFQESMKKIMTSANCQ